MPRHSPRLYQSLLNTANRFALTTLPVINPGQFDYDMDTHHVVDMLHQIDEEYTQLQGIHQHISKACHVYAVQQLVPTMHEQEKVQQTFRRQLRRHVPAMVKGTFERNFNVVLTF